MARAHRIAVSSTVPDARAQGYLASFRNSFPRAKATTATVVSCYTIDARLSREDLATAAKRLANPITEKATIDTLSAPKGFACAIEIGFLPGVTDNVGKTAKQTIEDAIGRKFKESESVYSSMLIFLSGKISTREAEGFARGLHNSLIERASVYQAGTRVFPIVVPKVKLHASARADIVRLNVPDDELGRIGKQGIADRDGTRRGPLALSLHAMKVIQKHFKELGRNPTDVELESLAQTWSEHCKHTIFADPLDEVKEGIYRRYIKGATEQIRKEKGDKDFCVSVFTDNSGGIAFDDEYLVTHKVETHNSPSALDPFGGAITGIVGVNRDALGFGLGAKPIANVYGFCVADPEDKTNLFRDKEKHQPLLAARRILEGVVRGVNAGGNQSGIPTPLGFVAIDPRYRGKPLVFAGTVGLIPRKQKGKKLYEKKARPGDYIVMAGGRVGLDGIHGATFSSESLSSGSPATAVQIGDPITQKKLSDALVREARDVGLYTSITDNGAGGLSCAVAEMAKECGGCLVDLEKVPLKYPGLSPWQIWISESQERMTLSVPKKNWTKLKKVLDRHDVEATRIGVFTDSGRCVVRYKGKKVMDLGMEFLHDGRPIEVQKGKRVNRVHADPPVRLRRTGGLDAAFLELLSRPNVGSTAFIAQQYDSEVQGSSVTKPLQGRGRVNADAGVLQPLPNSQKGIVLSHGYAPWYSDIDTYHMAASAIDTAVRNAVCAGASREYLAILDNFCWSSSNEPGRLYELKRAAKACFDIATAYATPYISGKDSMFNDFRGFTAQGEKIHIAAPPTLLISAIGIIPDVSKAVTLDLKQEGDLLYLLGDTKDELGASEYFSMLGYVGAGVPTVDAKKNAKTYDALSQAMEEGLISSALGVGRGGLAVALAKSAVAGQFGADVDLSSVPGAPKNAESILFSESQGRVLVSIRPEAQREFEMLMRGVPSVRIGQVGNAGHLSIELPRSGFSIPLSKLTIAYRKPFKSWL
ncbi:MAG TPA: phosphoribosylformylglycinamidine synthase subunit PurL [Candidatus Paceibacterota bacterium]|nr:phosphoribosylformylglycinamidine synthase subunit PurL [Candidatus Paceibacterota bacterium]